MFNIFKSLTSLKIYLYGRHIKVENLGAMFQDCTALTKVPNINSWNLKNVDSIE